MPGWCYTYAQRRLKQAKEANRTMSLKETLRKVIGRAKKSASAAPEGPQHRLRFVRVGFGNFPRLGAIFGRLWRVRAAKLAAVGLLLIVSTALATWHMTAREPTHHLSDMDRANRALIEGDEQQALAYARKALDAEPNNVERILTVASLVKAHNAEEARALYGQALEIYKKHTDPNVPGQPTLVYWAAATLAEDAGQIALARQYYQSVINVADKSNDYEADLFRQSQEALERLR